MGRKKDKPGKPDGKSGKIRIPKQIGSVKIPKDVRKSGEALIEAARDAVVREMAVAGVAAIVANAARKATAPAAQSTAAPAAAPPAATVIIDQHGDKTTGDGANGERAKTSPDQMIDALGAMAGLALQRWMTGKPG